MADLHAASPSEAAAVVAAVFANPVVTALFALNTLLLTAGTATFGIALWRDGRLARTPIFLFAAGLILLTTAPAAGTSGASYAIDLVGGAALAAGGFWLARGVAGANSSEPSRQAQEASRPSRAR
jgi:hypothetical protein